MVPVASAPASLRLERLFEADASLKGTLTRTRAAAERCPPTLRKEARPLIDSDPVRKVVFSHPVDCCASDNLALFLKPSHRRAGSLYDEAECG